MLSVEKTKELLASLNLTDKEAEEIRDIAYMLAELGFDDWRQKRKKDNEQNQ